ncbi:MAG: hypothetical protein HY928_03305 [Elusimicrobia bacterium]|nr:hypothetical protein [Elusimicrobiota bacterium]
MVFFAVAAAAHDGPPFPVAVDARSGPYTMSVWADPDTGTGTFVLLAEGPEASEAELFVAPASGRLPEARWPALREPSRRGLRFVARPEFDAEEVWSFRALIRGPAGTGSVSGTVDVTPPDLGRAGMWLYLLPFLAVGALWAKALYSRRARPESSRPVG